MQQDSENIQFVGFQSSSFRPICFEAEL